MQARLRDEVGSAPRCPVLSTFDYIINSIIAGLVLLTPLAIGSVHRWAFTPIELVVMSMVIVWMAKLWLAASDASVKISPSISLRFAAPVAVFAALVLFQLVPLPPSLIRIVSPATYRTYTKALPGWPQTFPYSAGVLDSRTNSGGTKGSEEVLLPSIDEVRAGVPVPFLQRNGHVTFRSADENRKDASGTLAKPGRFWSWYPLAVAPSLTWAAFLKFVSYASTFFLVLGYPFSNKGSETRFYRSILITVVTSGILVALLGLAERVYWNGKILWFFVPHDWGGARIGSLPRARGPFVDPDHFSNYLAMTFPLVLVATFYGFPWKSKRRTRVTSSQTLGIAAVLIVFTAILLSLSRAGWAEVAFSILLFSFVWLTARRSNREGNGSNARGRVLTESSRHLWRHWSLRRMSLWLAGTSILLVIALAVVGPRGRAQSDIRLQRSIASGVLGARPRIWGNTLQMIRDFPVLGVGFGDWPEIFTHYETGEWSPYYFREAHDDYLQFIAETGAIGLLALVWISGLIGASLFTALKRPHTDEWPLLAALCISLGTTVFGELFDFNLHIPANAFLFTLLLALATRLALRTTSREKSTEVEPHCIRVASGAVVVSTLILMTMTIAQNGRAYPYDISAPDSVSAARAIVLAHPVSYQAHLSLISLAGDRMRPRRLREERASAVWLYPTDPYLRDTYAASLSRSRERIEFLHQINESVFDSPASSTHFYLGRRFIPWLSSEERAAIEKGYKEAIAAHYRDAIGGLAYFYDALGRFSKEAQLYARAAVDTGMPIRRARYFVAASEAALRAGNRHCGERFLRNAIAAAPAQAQPYIDLITKFYGPAKKMRAAQSVAKLGICNGVAPASLYLALGEAAESNGDESLAASAMVKALDYQPSFGMIMRVGNFYSSHSEYGRAIVMFHRALALNPYSADAFAMLGRAAENDYQYVEADKAYARAARLDPDRFRVSYFEFKKQMSEVERSHHPSAEPAVTERPTRRRD